MKRITAAILAMAIAVASLQGCYGKFGLTKKVYRINGEIGDKYLRSLVTWVFIIVPVYGVAALVDFVLFNTIEFWSGNNPVAAGEKDFLYSENGDTFKVHAVKNGDKITYTFNHYRGNTHLDTLAVEWDMKSGRSVAALDEHGKTTHFEALKAGSGVQVTSSEEGGLTRGREAVALYQ